MQVDRARFCRAEIIVDLKARSFSFLFFLSRLT